MGILDDLNKIIIREDLGEDDDFDAESMENIISMMNSEEDETEKEEDGDDVGVDEMLKHIKNVKAAAIYLDSLTTDQGDKEGAFEAERSLRNAITKMEDLSKNTFKEKSKTEKKVKEERI